MYQERLWIFGAIGQALHELDFFFRFHSRKVSKKNHYNVKNKKIINHQEIEKSNNIFWYLWSNLTWKVNFVHWIFVFKGSIINLLYNNDKIAFAKFLTSILSLLIKYYLYLMCLGLTLILFIVVRLWLFIILFSLCAFFDFLVGQGRR